MEKNLSVSISHGNRKMGDIPSVSLPPVVTCAEHCTCAKKCYAAKLCRIYKTVREAYGRNLEILTTDPENYWRQVEDVVSVSRFFRFHVSGDIPNYEYLLHLVDVARNNEHCEMLVFTKRYSWVNKLLDSGVVLPSNLHILFSEWEGMNMENPHNMPVAHVIFKGQEPLENWNICPGNCLECAKNHVNCWALKQNEHVAFYEH